MFIMIKYVISLKAGVFIAFSCGWLLVLPVLGGFDAFEDLVVERTDVKCCAFNSFILILRFFSAYSIYGILLIIINKNIGVLRRGRVYSILMAVAQEEGQVSRHMLEESRQFLAAHRHLKGLVRARGIEGRQERWRCKRR